jgi:hypothetical protein
MMSWSFKGVVDLVMLILCSIIASNHLIIDHDNIDRMLKPLVASRFRSLKTITKALLFTRKHDKYVDLGETIESGDIPVEIFIVNKRHDLRKSISMSRLTTTSTSVIGDTAHQDGVSSNKRMQQMGMNAGNPNQDLPNENSTSDASDIETRKSMASEKEFAISIFDQNSTNKNAVLDALLIKMEQMSEVERKRSEAVLDLNALVTVLLHQRAVTEEGRGMMDQVLDSPVNKMQAPVESNDKLDKVINSNIHLTAQVIFLKGANEHVTRLLSEKEVALEEALSTIATLTKGKSSTTEEVIPQLMKSDWSVETVVRPDNETTLVDKDDDEEEAATTTKTPSSQLHIQ